MLPRRCILCCDTSITGSWHGRCVSSSASKATKSWWAGFLNGSLRSSRISSFIGKTVWSACLPDGSRVRRESHARFCERPVVKFHRPTQPFGPHCFEPNGRWYLGASPSKKSVARIKQNVGDLLVPNNVEAWPEVRDRLNQILRGWCAYFSYGTTAQAYRAVDYYVYESVRHYLRRRHQVRSRGTNSCFSRDAVYGRWALLNCVESGWGPVREPADEIQSESRMREIRMSGLMSVDGNERLPVGLAPRRSSTLPQLADSSTRRNCEDRSGLHNISLLLEGTN